MALVSLIYWLILLMFSAGRAKRNAGMTCVSVDGGGMSY